MLSHFPSMVFKKNERRIYKLEYILVHTIGNGFISYGWQQKWKRNSALIIAWDYGASSSSSGVRVERISN